jgi:hypothetical protein
MPVKEVADGDTEVWAFRLGVFRIDDHISVGPFSLTVTTTVES